jgi:hypothetical protein
MNPQEDRLFFFFGGVTAAMSSLQVTSQQPCHADVGLCDGGHLWLWHTGLAHLNMKTRHCISGCGRVVPWGLGLTHCRCLRPADGGGWCLLGMRTNGFLSANDVLLENIHYFCTNLNDGKNA